MKNKYSIISVVKGSWEWLEGDIVGVDKRTFIEKQVGFKIRNNKTGRILSKFFDTKIRAKKYIDNLAR